MSSDWKEDSIKRRDFRHTHNGPEVPKTSRGKKNTKKWCKGKEGREHTLASRPCRFFDYKGWSSIWLDTYCVDCGKITKYMYTRDGKLPWATITERMNDGNT